MYIGKRLLCIWVGDNSSSKPMSSKEVRHMKPGWAPSEDLGAPKTSEQKKWLDRKTVCCQIKAVSARCPVLLGTEVVSEFFKAI